MEAEEVEPLASLLQVHDPGLLRLELKPNSARSAAAHQAPPRPRARVRHIASQIVGVANESRRPAHPSTAGQAGADRRCTGSGEITPPCGVPVTAARDRPVLHHPRAQHRTQQLQDLAVADPSPRPPTSTRHAGSPRNNCATSVSTTHRLPSQASSMRTWSASCCRAAWAETRSEHGSKVSLEDRLDAPSSAPPARRDHVPWDRQRPLLAAARLRYEDPAGRRAAGSSPSFRSAASSSSMRVTPYCSNVGDGLSVDAGRAAIARAPAPTPAP